MALLSKTILYKDHLQCEIKQELQSMTLSSQDDNRSSARDGAIPHPGTWNQILIKVLKRKYKVLIWIKIFFEDNWARNGIRLVRKQDPHWGKLVVVTDGRQFAVQNLDLLYVLVFFTHNISRRDMTYAVLKATSNPK